MLQKYNCVRLCCSSVFVMATGCQQGTPDHFSRLAGVWYFREGWYNTTFRDGSVERKTLDYTNDEPHLIIREDGSFDWSKTMWALFGPQVKQLREKGDSATSPFDPHPRIEVLESKYSPTLSYALVRLTVPHLPDTTVSCEARIGLFRVATYREERSSPDTSENFVLFAKLGRFEGELPWGKEREKKRDITNYRWPVGLYEQVAVK